MKNQSRLGFLSVTGVLAAVVVLLGVLGWSILAGPTPFSPGGLNSVAKARSYGGVSTHSQLDAKCEACHTAPWSSETMADKCLACHTEIVAQLKSGTGLHGRMLDGLMAPTCKGCHTEHHGATGLLTVQDPATFPHDLTKFSLRGHERSSTFSPMTCQDCHPDGVTSFDVATCSACHTKLDAAFMREHEAAFGTKCLLCHNGKGTDLTNFDHNKLPFKLTGKHAGVKCDKCHASGSLSSATGGTARDCYACHAKDDEHKGKFGKNCGDCHSTNGWEGAKFDHAIFPVNHGREGGGTNECKTCHPNGITSYTCYGCHEHTVANVLAEHRGKTAAQLADCVKCHKGGAEGGD